MGKYIKVMLHNRLLSLMVMVMLFLAGIVIMNTTRREDLPTVSLNKITITTIYPGADPEGVQLNVTVPIERELAGISGIEYYTSLSTENLSLITIQADYDYSRNQMQRLLDQVKNAIDQVDDLPDALDGRPLVTELDVEKMPMLEIALSGEMKAVREYARRLADGLRTVPGVARISRVGLFDREIHVELKPNMLEELHVSFDEVIHAIRARNVRVPGGTIDSASHARSLVTLARFDKPQDVGKVILRSNFERRKVVLTDVASVRSEWEDRGLLVRNNGRSGISLVVTKQAPADVIRTVDSVRDYVRRFPPPQGVELAFVDDSSLWARDTISALILNGALGFFLVLLVLLVFLNVRTALWCAFSIPFSIFAAFAFFPLFGLTINNVALIGFLIVIGMLVDDAIVTSEHIEHYREKGMSPLKASLRGAREMLAPVSAAVFTTIAAYVPLFFLGGLAGKFVWAVPLTVCLALLASLFDSFFLLPGHLAHTKFGKREKAVWLVRIEAWYRALLRKAVHLRRPLLAGLAILFVVTFLWLLLGVRLVLFPNLGSEKFHIKFKADAGTNLAGTRRYVEQVERILLREKKKHNEILAFTSRIGHMDPQGSSRTSGNRPNRAVTTVHLASAQHRQRDTFTIINHLRTRIGNIPGCRIMVEESRKSPFQSRPVQIAVLGNNSGKRGKVVDRIWRYLKQVPGVFDLERDDHELKQQLLVRLDYEKLAAYGMTSADVASLVRVAFNGQRVSSLRTMEEDIWYRVILPPALRNRPDSLSLLKVRNHYGALVGLDQLVRVEPERVRQNLYHRDGIQAVTITGDVNIKENSALQVAASLRRDLFNNWELPLGINVVVGGEAKDTVETMRAYLVALAVALVAIFFIVSLVLKKVSQTLLVLATVPCSIIGVTWALTLHGLPLSMFSLMGILGLAGIVVNDAIVMLDRFNHNLEYKSFTMEQLVKQASTRLRPILMTTLTTVGGLLPAAYGIGGRDVFLVQMAVTLAYGLIFASLVNLFLVPALYYMQALAARQLSLKERLAKIRFPSLIRRGEQATARRRTVQPSRLAPAPSGRQGSRFRR